MSSPATPQWADPLFSPGDRFPLGAPANPATGRRDRPSAMRPFSLRGTTGGPRIDGSDGFARYRYDHERQVALVEDSDGVVVPLLKHTRPGATPVTSGSPDGQGGKQPAEEMASPDYQSD